MSCSIGYSTRLGPANKTVHRQAPPKVHARPRLCKTKTETKAKDWGREPCTEYAVMDCTAGPRGKDQSSYVHELNVLARIVITTLRSPWRSA